MSRFFSLVTPAPGQERDAAREWSAGAYAEHQWLWRFLPAPGGTARSFLFRRRDVDGLPRFYVVADREPVSPSPHWTVQCKPYAPELAAGQWLAFELRANPVVTVRDASGRQARHDVVMQEKKRLLAARGMARWAEWTTPDRPALADLVQRCGAAWLQARCQRLGVRLDEATLRADGYEQHGGKRGELRFSTLDFAGLLQVEDPAALRAALFEGVGHAKAFGCGLLLVRPAR
ncbi:MAG: type I-E CRISPR-associated protein Cas6/Cse3/CasE [Burkholderiales bacterium]|nr:type I-E CRISPR-associated protein Cas6/Cse3/CasE [Burkholderiales bacterium]